MPTDWNLPDVAEHYEDYDPIRERALAYPLMFEALGLADPACKTVLDYGCGTGKVAERIVRAYGTHVIAADPSPGMLGIARSKRPYPEIDYRRIEDDQRLEVPNDSVDAALSCFICVCIPEADRIRRIANEVYRVLRPGARFAMLELNPDSIGIPFAIAKMGEQGKSYGAGDPIEVILATPSGVPMVVVDYHWPKDVHVGFLSAAGFRAIEVHTPTLPETYEGADAERMQVERAHPPYAIYVAQK